jgi:hypothetical protein
VEVRLKIRRLLPVPIVGVLALASFLYWRQANFEKFERTCPSIDRVQFADAHADALSAMRRGDNHLPMLGGYVGTVPGGENSSLPNLMMDGTSDTDTVACGRARPVAEQYARKYNETVVSQLHR